MDYNIEIKNIEDILFIYKYEYPYKAADKCQATKDIYENFFVELILSYDHYYFIDRINILKEKIKNLSEKKMKK